MGCANSNQAGDDTKKIDYVFTYTNVYNLDLFFGRARDVLSDIEKIRSGLEDNRELLMKESLAGHLKESSFKEALKMTFWCLSANSEGKIENCGVKIKTIPPYILANTTNMRFETAKLWQYLHDYLATIQEGVSKIQHFVKEFLNIVEEAPTYLTRCGEEANRSG